MLYLSTLAHRNRVMSETTHSFTISGSNRSHYKWGVNSRNESSQEGDGSATNESDLPVARVEEREPRVRRRRRRRRRRQAHHAARARRGRAQHRSHARPAAAGAQRATAQRCPCARSDHRTLSLELRSARNCRWAPTKHRPSPPTPHPPCSPHPTPTRLDRLTLNRRPIDSDSFFKWQSILT